MTHKDEREQMITEDTEEKVFSVREFLILTKEMERRDQTVKNLRIKSKTDEKFLAVMIKAWDTIEEEMDAEIASLKERIAQLEDDLAYEQRVSKALLLGNNLAEDAEAQADADQARAMAKAENDEWREREMGEDFYRNMESGPETPSDRF